MSIGCVGKESTIKCLMKYILLQLRLIDKNQLQQLLNRERLRTYFSELPIGLSTS